MTSTWFTMEAHILVCWSQALPQSSGSQPDPRSATVNAPIRRLTTVASPANGRYQFCLIMRGSNAWTTWSRSLHSNHFRELADSELHVRNASKTCNQLFLCNRFSWLSHFNYLFITTGFFHSMASNSMNFCWFLLSRRRARSRWPAWNLNCCRCHLSVGWRRCPITSLSRNKNCSVLESTQQTGTGLEPWQSHRFWPSRPL